MIVVFSFHMCYAVLHDCWMYLYCFVGLIPLSPLFAKHFFLLFKKEEETPWKEVWDAMKRSGWGWRGGSGLMTDYYYIKPECKIKGGTVGQDYFISVKDVQTYARNIYKWGVVSHEKLMATIEEFAKYSGEVVPPQAEGQEIKANESWGDAWKKMLKSGWNWKAGSGLMMDYFYIKPGCKIKGSVEGQDYFTSLEDVQKFASRNYGWVGDEENNGEYSFYLFIVVVCAVHPNMSSLNQTPTFDINCQKLYH